MPWREIPRSHPVPAGAVAWLDGLEPRHIPDGRFAAAPDEVLAGIRALLAEAATPDARWREWFAADCAGLAAGFARQTGAARLGVRLDRITDDAC